ncbi:hypothetical protein EDC94DRAFT_618169 [Helicostylum pulchrum]|nr:hypothetical protein EDC94DRAFT_618169 [Helicostylum pulchrum]
MFSFENQVDFTKILKEYISKNILNETLTTQKVGAATIGLSTSCSCKFDVTINDITEISFRPVLQNIISLVSTSVINRQLFGKYRKIQYMFHLIRFNYNPQFQHILMKILNDETDYFLYEQRIDMDHYTIPKLLNQPLQPILQQQPFSYKAFQVGVLYPVYSENYGFSLITYGTNYSIKNKISDSKITSADYETVFPLFQKGNKINNSLTKRVFYLSLGKQNFSLKLFKLKETDTLTFDKALVKKDTFESFDGPNLEGTDFSSSQYKPLILSVFFEGYSSSLSLVARQSGSAIKAENLTLLAEPMTLARI